MYANRVDDKGCARSSTDLEIAKPLGLQFSNGCDAGRHEFEKRILAGLGRVDLQATIGNLAQVSFDSVFGQTDKSLMELRVDILLLPRRSCPVCEEELDARCVCDH